MSDFDPLAAKWGKSLYCIEGMKAHRISVVKKGSIVVAVRSSTLQSAVLSYIEVSSFMAEPARHTRGSETGHKLHH